MVCSYTFVLLFAVLWMATARLEEINANIAGFWKLRGCSIDDTTPSLVNGTLLTEAILKITYTKDDGTDVFKWVRKQDHGRMRGNIYRDGDKWLSDCNIDKKAKSEAGRQMQNEVAANCDKVIAMYYIVNEMHLLQLYPNGLCSYTRLCNCLFKPFYAGGRYG